MSVELFTEDERKLGRWTALWQFCQPEQVAIGEAYGAPPLPCEEIMKAMPHDLLKWFEERKQ
jgi:hypothetical protein